MDFTANLVDQDFRSARPERAQGARTGGDDQFVERLLGRPRGKALGKGGYELAFQTPLGIGVMRDPASLIPFAGINPARPIIELRLVLPGATFLGDFLQTPGNPVVREGARGSAVEGNDPDF